MPARDGKKEHTPVQGRKSEGSGGGAGPPATLSSASDGVPGMVPRPFLGESGEEKGAERRGRQVVTTLVAWRNWKLEAVLFLTEGLEVAVGQQLGVQAALAAKVDLRLEKGRVEQRRDVELLAERENKAWRGEGGGCMKSSGLGRSAAGWFESKCKPAKKEQRGGDGLFRR